MTGDESSQVEPWIPPFNDFLQWLFEGKADNTATTTTSTSEEPFKDKTARTEIRLIVSPSKDTAGGHEDDEAGGEFISITITLPIFGYCQDCLPFSGFSGSEAGQSPDNNFPMSISTTHSETVPSPAGTLSPASVSSRLRSSSPAVSIQDALSFYRNFSATYRGSKGRSKSSLAAAAFDSEYQGRGGVREVPTGKDIRRSRSRSLPLKLARVSDQRKGGNTPVPVVVPVSQEGLLMAASDHTEHVQLKISNDRPDRGIPQGEGRQNRSILNPGMSIFLDAATKRQQRSSKK